MSWKQIPHPPDWRPLGPGPEHLTLEVEGLRLAVDTATGRAISLCSTAAGADFLAPPDAAITFRLLDTRGLWIDGPACGATEVRAVDGRGAEVVYDQPRQCGVTFPVRLTLRYDLASDATFGPSVRCSYSLEHLGGESVIERVQFPVLTGLDEFAGERTELILPFIGGERRPAPLSGGWSDFEYIYPNEAMSWMLLHDSARGLYLASEDPSFRWTVLRGRTRRKSATPSLELLFETVPYLRAGGSCESQTFVLYPYAGTWHRAADRYRAWLETWWKPLDTPDWVRELRGLCELFLEMTNADGSVVRAEPDELFEYMQRCHAELGLDVAHICGYHEGGFDAQYPLYEPLERIGGSAGLRKFIARCNAQPGWTTDIYINCRITDVATEWWGQEGRRWACTSKDSTYFTEHYNGRYFTVACPAVRERTEYWVAKVRTLTRDLGSEGLQVDQPHTTARECWAFEVHDHETPFDHWGPGYIELFRAVRNELVAHGPRVWSWGEAASDVFSQFFDFSCCYVRYPDQKVAFGETDPETRDWVHDWRGYGMPEVFRYCCPEIPMIQGTRVTGDDIEGLIARLNVMFMFSPMVYWPSLSIGYDLELVPERFRSYFRRLWDLRHDLRDTMIHGRFRDVVGLDVSPQSVYAKLYVAGGGRRPGITVVAINRDSDASVQARVAVRQSELVPGLEAADWSWQERALTEPAGQRGEGTASNLLIPANRLALIHFEPAHVTSNNGAAGLSKGRA